MNVATLASGTDQAGGLSEVPQIDSEQLGHDNDEHTQPDNNAVEASVLGDEASDANLTGTTTVECGCISPTKDHLENLQKWREDMNKALSKLPAIDIQYKRVVVLMAYWAVSDVSHLSKHAEDLKAVFESYGYTVVPHVLDNKRAAKKDDLDIFNEFKDKLDGVIRKVSVKDEANLLILYYAGHGATLDGKKPEDTAAPYVWQPTQSNPTHRLQFRQCQPMLMNMRADVLFVFDCCYALAMIEEGEFQIWNQRSEILAASSALEEASAVRKSSFTTALAEELKSRAKQRGQGANWYYTLLTSTERTRRHKLVQAPLWRRYSRLSFRTGIFLQDKNWVPPEPSAAGGADTDSGLGSSIASIASQERLYQRTIDDLTNLSDIRVLIKIRLRNPAEQLLEADWMEMFEHRPSNVDSIEVNVVDKVVCHGLFESDSSILLVTVPIWLWQTVEHNTSYENLGVVRSDNLLAPGRAAGMIEVATGFSPPARAKQQQRTLDESNAPVVEATPAEPTAVLTPDQTPVEHAFRGERAEMKLSEVEKELLEKEDVVRRKGQELVQLELDMRDKEAKARELERKAKSTEEKVRQQREEVNVAGEKLREMKNEVNSTRGQVEELESEVNASKRTVMQQQKDMGLAEAKLKEFKDETNAFEGKIKQQQKEVNVMEEEVRHQQKEVNLAKDSVMGLNTEAAVAATKVKELGNGIYAAEEKLNQQRNELNLAESKVRELEERAGVAEEKKRKHDETVRLAERRLAERERDLEQRELLLRQTRGRPSKGMPMPVFWDALSAANDLVSPDPAFWQGWGKTVMDLPNSRFQNMVVKKTDLIGDRKARRILAGRGM
ncbi:hypothetical protein LTR46_005784 [Exophiala xenobiotica]|nr:hypothetical protein LTR46_005784 [Exophiala xenobiotica]